MRASPTDLPGVLVLEPRVHEDARGSVFESWNERTFEQVTGLPVRFVQENHSHSVRHVIRGLHYQLVRPQGKLLRVTSGRVFDVAVDLRRGSRRCGQWVGVEVSAANRRQVWIPPGFGHGFLVLSETADLVYKLTDFWCSQHERSVRWNDPALGIAWPLDGAAPVVAAKDAAAPLLAAAELYD